MDFRLCAKGTQCLSDTFGTHEMTAEEGEFLDQCYERSRKLLSENKEDIDMVAQALLEKEVLESEDVDRIMEQNAMRSRSSISNVANEPPESGEPTE